MPILSMSERHMSAHEQVFVDKTFPCHTCSGKILTNLPHSGLHNWYIQQITKFQQFLFNTLIEFFFHFHLLLFLQWQQRLRTKSSKLCFCYEDVTIQIKWSIQISKGWQKRYIPQIRKGYKGKQKALESPLRCIIYLIFIPHKARKLRNINFNLNCLHISRNTKSRTTIRLK